MEQMILSMLPPLQDDESLADLERQANLMSEYGKQKRRWENAFHGRTLFRSGAITWHMAKAVKTDTAVAATAQCAIGVRTTVMEDHASEP